MEVRKTSLFRNLCGYCIAFGLTVFVALVLLLASAFLPQERINANILNSIDLINYDLANLYLFEYSEASKMDVGTDVMMMRSCVSTKSEYLGSVLTNPIYVYDGLSEWDDTGEILARLAYEMPSDDVWFYARYWLGFRGPIRLALTFFDYGQIKRYLAFLFFVLFASSICSVAKNTNARQAFLFAVSIILVRPHVMATSMQFTCCFLIAFIGMLFIPALYRSPKYETLFFMELGMITMYFDFYTVPLLTFGLPMLYLCLIREERGKGLPVRNILRNFFTWSAGYGFMWLAKLCVTTLLTEVDALKQGLESFAGRVGIRKTEGLERYYSVEAALDGVRDVIFSDGIGQKVYLIGAAVIFGCTLVLCIRRGDFWKRFRKGLPFLLFSVMPIAWFCAAKQPTAIHAYFQYRSIVLTHWGIGVFCYYLARAEYPGLR